MEVLLGEIDKLEQDEGLLKTMEKDLTVLRRLCSTLFPSLFYFVNVLTFLRSSFVVCPLADLLEKAECGVLLLP